MGLLPFAVGLTLETNKPLIVATKASFDIVRESTLAPDATKTLRKLFLLAELIHEALKQPDVGGVIFKTTTL